MTNVNRRLTSILLVAGLALGACGTGDDIGDGETVTSIVVTTSVLGDVVQRLVGAAADVSVIMPAGTSPHEFQPSARDRAMLAGADVVIANGGGLEAGLSDVLADVASDGVVVFSAVEGDGSRGPRDRHFFTDPYEMRDVADEILTVVAASIGVGEEALRSEARDGLAELSALGDEVSDLVEPVPLDDRVLLTAHEMLGAFAERYGFQIVAVVVEGATSSADARRLATVAALIREVGVGTVFVDAAESDEAARTVAAEVPGVEIVELHIEALGPGGSGADSYVGMIRSNVGRIVAALA